MAHRFGEFFLDPEWPAQADKNSPHFANLDQDQDQDQEDDEASACKDAELNRGNVKMEFEEMKLKRDDDYDQVIVKEENFSESQDPSLYEEDSSYSENLSKIKKQIPTKRSPSPKLKSKPLKKSKQISRIAPASRTKRKKVEFERGRYKILSQQLKKKIVEQTKTMTMVQVARKYHVSVNNICRWRKRCDRRSGAGRKVTDMEMQKKLLQWLMKQTGPISRKQVQQAARRMSGQQGFKASKGWFERFYKRNKLNYNTSIEILTHNDYRQRLSRLLVGPDSESERMEPELKEEEEQEEEMNE